MEIKFDNRLALVTGASGAIGSVVCSWLGKAGARVIGSCTQADMIHADDLTQNWQAQGVDMTLMPFDVADAASSAAAIASIKAEHGPIDILVNCAGITRDAPLHKMTAEQWQQVLRVDLDSVFNTTQPLIADMLERRWGRVVNIASINGQKGQYGQTNYSAAKAGVHGFTMALAQEVARKNVTVNTVSPGYVDSPMIRAVPEHIRVKILDSIPAGRFGEPQDIAATVTFLCSEQAAFINGANLPVNGAQYTS